MQIVLTKRSEKVCIINPLEGLKDEIKIMISV